MSDIVITNLSFQYENEIVFKDFNATFKEKQINVLLGESGIGKTTLLNCIAGINKYDGKIEGNDKVSYIFQSTRLIDDVSVFKNLSLVLKNVYKDKEVRKEKILAMLKVLEIEDIKDKLPSKISGGQAQRVSLARAFLYPSNLLLLDEAFKEVDEKLKERLIKVFLDVWNNDKRTVIMVTHDINEAHQFSSNIQILKGKPATIFKD